MVERTAGYSGSDMRDLLQEACAGPLRDAARATGAAFADLKPEDLRPVVLRDFKVQQQETILIRAETLEMRTCLPFCISGSEARA